MARECARGAGSRLAKEACACARMRVDRKHPKPRGKRGKLLASGVLLRVVTEFRLLEFGTPEYILTATSSRSEAGGCCPCRSPFLISVHAGLTCRRRVSAFLAPPKLSTHFDWLLRYTYSDTRTPAHSPPSPLKSPTLGLIAEEREARRTVSGRYIIGSTAGSSCESLLYQAVGGEPV